MIETSIYSHEKKNIFSIRNGGNAEAVNGTS
jgi:hypothetical protein